MPTSSATFDQSRFCESIADLGIESHSAFVIIATKFSSQQTFRMRLLGISLKLRSRLCTMSRILLVCAPGLTIPSHHRSSKTSSSVLTFWGVPSAPESQLFHCWFLFIAKTLIVH
jgi:hypothetical protein